MRDLPCDHLRAFGWHVRLAKDTLPTGSSDPKQLAEAAARGLILVTRNRVDFELVHEAWIRAGGSHAGILTAFKQPADFAMGIQMLFESLTTGDLRDRLFIWDSASTTWHVWE